MSFRVRLNNIDSYQSVPTSLDPLLPSVRPGEYPRSVPVIRVFGATETGQKVCAHIHGVFPYLYVEYTGSLIPDEVDVYIRRLHAGIDRAMAVAYKSQRREFYVARITLCKGVPFYGYHVGYKFYLKIYLLNPGRMTRLADLLRGGAVGKQFFQPYEAHIPYILGFMIDFNLYGCGFIDCGKVRFRTPIPSADEVEPDALWHDESVPPELRLPESEYPRVSHCALEVDVQMQDILNQKQITPRNLHNDFTERTNPLPADMKYVHSLAELWKDDSRRRGIVEQPKEEIAPTATADRDTSAQWIHEGEYMEQIKSIIDEERRRADKPMASFDNFVKRKPFEGLVKTAVDSVKDFFPENQSEYGVFIAPPGAHEKRQLEETIEVDEDLINKVIAEADEDDESFDDIDIDALILGDAIEDTAPNANPEDAIGNQPMPGPSKSEGALVPGKPMENISQKTTTSTTGTVHKKEENFATDDGIMEVDGDEEEFDIPEEFFSKVAPKRALSLEPITVPAKIRKIDLSPLPSPSFNSQTGSFRSRTPRSSANNTPRTQKQHPSFSGYPVVKDHGSMVRLSQAAPSQKSSFGSGYVDPITPTKLSGSWGFPGTPLNPSSSPGIDKQIKSIASDIARNFARKSTGITICLGELGPSNEELLETLDELGITRAIYQDAYYSNEKDIPSKPREYAGREFKLGSNTVPYLPDFDPSGDGTSSLRVDWSKSNALPSFRRWEIANPPPSREETENWLKENLKSDSRKTKKEPLPDVPDIATLSQIEGPTQENRYGAKFSLNKGPSSVIHEAHHMSILSLEVHVNSRGTLFPDPAQDEIACIFWCLYPKTTEQKSNGIKEAYHVGILVLADQGSLVEKYKRMVGVTVEEEDTELDLITRLVDMVRNMDPDILTGYEIHNSSWGYIIERARAKFEYDLCGEFSRMKSQSHGRFGKESDSWGFNTTAAIKVTGRHLINIWRAMRGELSLTQYTMENVAFHLLHQRIPHYSHQDLTSWYTCGKPRLLNRLLQYYIKRVQINLEILEHNELVSRTSEQARLLGIDFQSVFGRGSQYKVESMMFRIGKPEGFMMISPSKKQVGNQNASECLPLVMEPQSAFYTSPVVVLDFQSLYPSLMIAYNYCYSTFLGRVTGWRGENKMGFMNYQRTPRMLELLKDYIRVAPNGIMYATQGLRKSLLAKMLGELLDTRIMVKNGMKSSKGDKALYKLLNNRQLALKLVANVTYGYTMAGFSGRMPCAEIADSIVQTGRETLEKAIELIHSEPRWNAEVVYGDTDSLFIHFPGRTRLEAFTLGEEIANLVTSLNPKPVKLKFEKVYHPCILLSKKRYVGFKYETRGQTEPDFDAKGIETVRRDGTAAQQKIEEMALKILFRTADLSKVKEYFQRQCMKIMSGKISIQDFCFAKEVKLGSYSEKGTLPGGAKISTEKMNSDHRAEPQYGERVPYVVIAGPPGSRLIDRIVPPETLLHNTHHRLDAEYYISKNLIPPLERIFNLVGADVRGWYNEMPKIRKVLRVQGGGGGGGGGGGAVVAQAAQAGVGGGRTGKKKQTLEAYLKSSVCLVCKGKVDTHDNNSICTDCLQDRSRSLYKLHTSLRKSEKKNADLLAICRSCSGLGPLEKVACDSLDCPVFYSRVRSGGALEADRESIVPAIRALERLSLEW
ncbi:hypothetical protein DFH27DRAFT_557681 [Peziza echinospora]|nr:hypothetical protein DFH27DRAFT_557681 [Peziza echinospora]